MADRSIRSLTKLTANGSSARVLNLLQVWAEHGSDPEYRERPFFASPILNRGIIVKHRLRRDERDMFVGRKQVATKVILPLDPGDLRIGGRSFFVGQIDYARMLHDISPASEVLRRRDETLLELLDTLPSLDPFLMRERLKEADYLPAACYFNLSESDIQRVYGFLRQELEPLIAVSFAGAPDVLAQKTAKLAGKILANAGDAELEPLRLVLGMSPADFAEGVFCWKGYVYYKWRMSELLPQVGPVAKAVAQIRAYDTANKDGAVYIAASRRTVRKAIHEACRSTRAALSVYDEAFADLTENGEPKAFRQFLLRSPEMFRALGERLGVLEHIASFWRYRFPEGEPPAIRLEELRDIFMDFETGLNASLEQPIHPGLPSAA